jgi:hypothetical protein
MHTDLHHILKRLALAALWLSTNLMAFGADEDFAQIAKQTLAEIHAKNFRDGNIERCVSLYAGNAKFFVANKLVATGEKELLELYKGLREVDRIRKIEIDEFVDVGSKDALGWVIFNYTKEYDLTNYDPQFIKSHKLDGFSSLNVKQYGTAIFSKIDGHWRIQTMTVFDPKIWEPQKTKG